MKAGEMDTFLRWSFVLQQQQVKVTRELAALHAGNRDEALRLLGNLARAVRVVPVWSSHGHAIPIYAGARSASKPDGNWAARPAANGDCAAKGARRVGRTERKASGRRLRSGGFTAAALMSSSGTQGGDARRSIRRSWSKGSQSLPSQCGLRREARRSNNQAPPRLRPDAVAKLALRSAAGRDTASRPSIRRSCRAATSLPSSLRRSARSSSRRSPSHSEAF